ncbi:MAG TPA: hypothetical protein VM141_11540 [Planctomycetota bacterium]|nr:hypothetical protein [Planctomycetota bacterium]
MLCKRSRTVFRISHVALLLMVGAPLFLASCGKKDDPEKSGGQESALSKDDDTQLISTGSAVEIIIEAEKGTVIAPMVIEQDEPGAGAREIFTASNGAYVELPEGAGKGESVGGKIIFDFEIEEPGKYMLWARVNWLDSCGNSFGVVMDDGPTAIIGEDGTHKCWQWVNIKDGAGIYRLSKGSHKLEFRNTEDGVKLDQIILTTDLDEQAQPQGIR